VLNNGPLTLSLSPGGERDRVRGNLRNQFFDFSQHLILGKMPLSGSLAGTDRSAGAAALAQRFIDY